MHVPTEFEASHSRTRISQAFRLSNVVLGFTLAQWVQFCGIVGVGAGSVAAGVWKLSAQYSDIGGKLDDHSKRLAAIETTLDRIAPRTLATAAPRP